MKKPAAKPAPKSPFTAKWESAKFSPAMQAKWNAACRPMLELIAAEKAKTTIVDPTGKHKLLASVVGGLLFGKPCEEDRAWMGDVLLRGIEDLSPDELKKEFNAIVKMKRRAIEARAKVLPKNAKFAILLKVFKKQFGRLPETKAEFVDYCESKGCPFPRSYSGRTDIYTQIGIDYLPQRRERRGKPSK
jgi:hypothetical protein